MYTISIKTNDLNGFSFSIEETEQVSRQDTVINGGTHSAPIVASTSRRYNEYEQPEGHVYISGTVCYTEISACTCTGTDELCRDVNSLSEHECTIELDFYDVLAALGVKVNQDALVKTIHDLAMAKIEMDLDLEDLPF